MDINVDSGPAAPSNVVDGLSAPSQVAPGTTADAQATLGESLTFNSSAVELDVSGGADSGQSGTSAAFGFVTYTPALVFAVASGAHGLQAVAITDGATQVIDSQSGNFSLEASGEWAVTSNGPSGQSENVFRASISLDSAGDVQITLDELTSLTSGGTTTTLDTQYVEQGNVVGGLQGLSIVQSVALTSETSGANAAAPTTFDSTAIAATWAQDSGPNLIDNSLNSTQNALIAGVGTSALADVSEPAAPTSSGSDTGALAAAGPNTTTTEATPGSTSLPSPSSTSDLASILAELKSGFASLTDDSAAIALRTLNALFGKLNQVA